MSVSAVESAHVSLAGYHDLGGRPGFKLALTRDGSRWLLYVAHLFHSGWSVVDVTDPAEPAVVRFVPGPENTTTKQIQVADGLMVTALERPGSDWGVVGGERMDPSRPHEAGVALWDVADDPTDPVLLGKHLVGGRGTHRNFYAGGDHVYLCASPEGNEPTLGEAGTNPAKNYYLVVLDVSDPGAPEPVGEWKLGEQDPDRQASGGADPDSAYFHGPAYVRGDRAYVSYGRTGLVVLDVSDPTAPTEVARMGFGPSLGSYNGVHSAVPVPGTDLVAVNSEAVSEETPLEPGGDPLQYTFLVDVSEERQPAFEGRTHRGPRVVSAMPMPTPGPDVPYSNYHDKPGWFGPHNQHHPRGDPERLQSSELLFATYFNAGLGVFGVSDPLAPREAGHWVPEQSDDLPGRRRSQGTQLEDVLVDARGYAYCTDPQRGLYVLETDLV